MAEALAAPVEFGSEPEPKPMTMRVLQVLCAGDAVRLAELLSTEGQMGNHVSIDVNGGTGTSPVAVTSLFGMTSNDNTALHIVASRGHAEVVELVCENAPSLVATRNRSLDTPLHCAAKAGHRDVVACLLRKMHAGGEEEAAALRARNCLGATALYEAVRHHRTEVVDLLMREAPELSALTTDDGFSPLYLAVTINSLQMVQAILRPSSLGTSSRAAYSGPEGRAALHAAEMAKRGIAQEILEWKTTENLNLLAQVDSVKKTSMRKRLWIDRDTHVQSQTTSET